MNSSVIIYSPQISNRLSYICKIIFEKIISVSYTITNNAQLYQNSGGVLINYSKDSQLKGLHIMPHTLLYNNSIVEQQFEVSVWNNLKVFCITNPNGFWPFDIFAASFFLVTRYEEYTSKANDKHGRYNAEDSLAFKNNFLHIPIVNKWALCLAYSLQSSQGLVYKRGSFKYIPTVDIDVAYAYKNRGLKRFVLASLQSIIKLKISDFFTRIAVSFGIIPDYYDTYSVLQQIHAKCKLQPVYFFLIGAYSKYDKNLDYNLKENQKLIKHEMQHALAGIHPSYYSVQNSQIASEIRMLSDITQKQVIHSRFHYLRLQMPGSYQTLLQNGITNDYTMGYPSQVGFRAGICVPYPFYDLTTETETSLTIHPFGVMDGTLNEYLKLTPAQAIEKVKLLIDEVKAVNGTFYSLWHNSSLSEKGDWRGWTKVYTQLVDYACTLDE